SVTINARPETCKKNCLPFLKNSSRTGNSLSNSCKACCGRETKNHICPNSSTFNTEIMVVVILNRAVFSLKKMAFFNSFIFSCKKRRSDWLSIYYILTFIFQIQYHTGAKTAGTRKMREKFSFQGKI